MCGRRLRVLSQQALNLASRGTYSRQTHTAITTNIGPLQLSYRVRRYTGLLFEGFRKAWVGTCRAGAWDSGAWVV